MDAQQKRERLATYAKWSLGLFAAFLISPFVFLAVKGIVGLALAAILGLAVVNFAPVIAMKFANWKMKAAKWEASVNPVETLQNQYLERSEQLAKFLNEIRMFRTEVNEFERRVAQFTREQPDEAQTFVSQLEKTKRLLSMREQKYMEAKNTLAEFEKTIQKADAKWKMAQAALRMNKIAGEQDPKAFDRIMSEVAFDSVERSMSQAFSDLEHSLLNESSNYKPKGDKVNFEGEAVTAGTPEGSGWKLSADGSFKSWSKG